MLTQDELPFLTFPFSLNGEGMGGSEGSKGSLNPGACPAQLKLPIPPKLGSSAQGPRALDHHYLDLENSAL